MNTAEMARHKKEMYSRGIDDCDKRIIEIMDTIMGIQSNGRDSAKLLRLHCAKLSRWIKRWKRYMLCRDLAEKEENNVD